MSIFGIPIARILSLMTAGRGPVDLLVFDRPIRLKLGCNTVFRNRISDEVVASKK